MKNLLTIVSLLFALCGFAQSPHAAITLKSGVVITGHIKELVATDHVTIEVAGTESKISMSDVVSIETTDSKSGASIQQESNLPISELKYGEYKELDSKDYPETITVNLNGEQIEMILIRGGWFNMGYDERHSLSMKTEPVHQVTLTSYYISKQPLGNSVVKELTAGKVKAKSKKKYYGTDRWEKANEITQIIAENKLLPFRLVSEAEWEYAALMPNAEELFGSEKEFDWCFDFMDEYQPQKQTDPLGPESGKTHVYRSYNIGRNKWQRKFSSINYDEFQVEPLIRLVIKAKFINNTNI